MSGHGEMRSSPFVKIGMTLVLLAAIAAPTQERSLREKGNAADDGALFRRTAAQLLAREFPSADISYLLMEVKTGSFIAKRWDRSDIAVPAGSLVKPFTALAYAQAHAFHFPEFTCTP